MVERVLAFLSLCSPHNVAASVVDGNFLSQVTCHDTKKLQMPCCKGHMQNPHIAFVLAECETQWLVLCDVAAYMHSQLFSC